jgi:hypothetical protein
MRSFPQFGCSSASVYNLRFFILLFVLFFLVSWLLGFFFLHFYLLLSFSSLFPKATMAVASGVAVITAASAMSIGMNELVDWRARAQFGRLIKSTRRGVFYLTIICLLCWLASLATVGDMRFVRSSSSSSSKKREKRITEQSCLLKLKKINKRVSWSPVIISQHKSPCSFPFSPSFFVFRKNPLTHIAAGKRAVRGSTRRNGWLAWSLAASGLGPACCRRATSTPSLLRCLRLQSATGSFDWNCTFLLPSSIGRFIFNFERI